MRVTILGHASLLLEAGGQRVLLDPVLRATPLLGGLVQERPRALALERMPAPTLVVVTHHHFDHFDLPTLGELDRGTPVLIPPDRRMARRLRAMGFETIHTLGDWEALTLGDLRLVATPSEAQVVELGLLVEGPGARYWHMSDAEPPPGAGLRLRQDYGRVDAVSAKFQPADPQLNFQHNLGSSFDRTQVARWLETACAVAPRLAFPYASGLIFEGERAWLNRYAYPFDAEHVAGLLDERLAGTGRGEVLGPGDVITIDDGRVGVERQASAFVRQSGPAPCVDWEPFDERPLAGSIEDDERDRLVEELSSVLQGAELAAWLVEHAAGEGSLLAAFRRWRVQARVVIHLGAGQRRCYHVDFGAERPVVGEGADPRANYFVHMGAVAARRLLAGEASPLEVMLGGDVRIHERILAVRDGRLEAPSTVRLYEDFPDPLLSFGGRRRRP